MISEKHSAAARANGARSRGPVTPEGKAISSRNAVRHGLLSDVIVLPSESPEMFQMLFDVTIARFAPVDEVEMALIEEMAAAYWRLRRCMALETATLTESLGQWPNKSSIGQMAAAYRDLGNAPHLDRLERYQMRLQNAYHRALRTLLHMRKAANRTMPPFPPEALENMRNEPSAPNVCNTDSAPSPQSIPLPELKPSSEYPVSHSEVREPACQTSDPPLLT